MLELDSSSPHKFSRHIIVRIPGAAFQNNFHVGAFVKDMCAAQESTDPDNPVQQLLINKVDLQHAAMELHRVHKSMAVMDQTEIHAEI